MRVLLLLCLLATLSAQAQPCACKADTSIKRSLENADAVVTGTVTKRELMPVLDETTGFKYYRSKWTLALTEVYKGKHIKKPEMVLISGTGKGDCGLSLLPGKEYVVYAVYKDKYYAKGRKVDKFFYSDQCSRTRLKDQTEQDALSRIKLPRMFADPAAPEGEAAEEAEKK